MPRNEIYTEEVLLEWGLVVCELFEVLLFAIDKGQNEA